MFDTSAGAGGRGGIPDGQPAAAVVSDPDGYDGLTECWLDDEASCALDGLDDLPADAGAACDPPLPVGLVDPSDTPSEGWPEVPHPDRGEVLTAAGREPVGPQTVSGLTGIDVTVLDAAELVSAAQGWSRV